MSVRHQHTTAELSDAFDPTLAPSGSTIVPPPAVAEEAPPSDRRHSQRIRQEVRAEISEWFGNRAGRSFGVVIQDLSTTGVGILHDVPLEPGGKYLLEIPRPNRRPLAAVFTVVRSDASSGGLFTAQLEPNEVLDVAVQATLEREPDISGRMWRIVFLLTALTFGGAVGALYVILF